MKGTSSFTPVFSSRLAPSFARYVDLKRALGRRFDLPARTLQSLDRFLCGQSAKYSDLNAAAFQAWCHTHEPLLRGFDDFACWRFGASALVSPLDRTAVLRSGPQFLSALQSTAQAIHLLRGRSGETAQCGCALETQSGIAASPGTDSACDRPPVHHGNAARGTVASDAR